MKKSFLAILSIIMLISCAPILSQNLIDKATFNVQLFELKKNPTLHKERLFILGGIIINTEVIEKGSVIEAIRVPVDSRGYLESINTTTGRYLAIYLEDKGLLEPIIFRKNRKITLAGKFIGLKKGMIEEKDLGMIEELEYIYPIFEIKELHLWRQWKTDSSGRTIIELERHWKMDFETSQSFHTTSDNDDKTITEIPEKSSLFYQNLHEKQSALVIEEVQTKDTDMHELTDSEQQQISKTEAAEVMQESKKLQEKEQTVDQRQSITESADSQVVDEEQSEPFADDAKTDKLTPQKPTNSGQIKEVTEKLKVKMEVSDLKKSLTKEVTTGSIEYYVQVGTWRNSKYAEEMLAKIKKYYDKAYIVEHNNFKKIRIPGVLTKIQGTIMSKDIEDKFNLKPLIVQKIQ